MRERATSEPVSGITAQPDMRAHGERGNLFPNISPVGVGHFADHQLQRNLLTLRYAAIMEDAIADLQLDAKENAVVPETTRAWLAGPTLVVPLALRNTKQIEPAKYFYPDRPVEHAPDSLRRKQDIHTDRQIGELYLSAEDAARPHALRVFGSTPASAIQAEIDLLSADFPHRGTDTRLSLSSRNGLVSQALQGITEVSRGRIMTVEAPLETEWLVADDEPGAEHIVATPLYALEQGRRAGRVGIIHVLRGCEKTASMTPQELIRLEMRRILHV